METIKKISVLMLTAVLMLTTASCGKNDSEQFRVCMECDFAPYNWTQESENEFTYPIEGGGFADGYDVQISKIIADKMGKELVIVKTDWDGLTMSVESGNTDAIIACMSPTEERKLTLDFTDSYCVYQYGMMVRRDSKYANAKCIDDLAGGTFSGQLNTVLYDLCDQIPDVNKAQATDSVPTLVVQANSGAIDGFVCESFSGFLIEESNPDLVYIGFEDGKGFDCDLGDRSVAIGIKKGSPLLSELNDILAEISDEERDELMDGAMHRQPK